MKGNATAPPPSEVMPETSLHLDEGDLIVQIPD